MRLGPPTGWYSSTQADADVVRPPFDQPGDVDLAERAAADSQSTGRNDAVVDQRVVRVYSPVMTAPAPRRNRDLLESSAHVREPRVVVGAAPNSCGGVSSARVGRRCTPVSGTDADLRPGAAQGFGARRPSARPPAARRRIRASSAPHRGAEVLRRTASGRRCRARCIRRRTVPSRHPTMSAPVHHRFVRDAPVPAAVGLLARAVLAQQLHASPVGEGAAHDLGRKGAGEDVRDALAPAQLAEDPRQAPREGVVVREQPPEIFSVRGARGGHVRLAPRSVPPGAARLGPGAIPVPRGASLRRARPCGRPSIPAPDAMTPHAAPHLDKHQRHEDHSRRSRRARRRRPRRRAPRRDAPAEAGSSAARPTMGQKR